jgi:hypothetical protein
MTFAAPTSVQDRTFTIRPFRESDYGPVAELFRRHDIEFLGETNYTEEVLRSDHASQVNFDPAESIRVAEAQDGSVVEWTGQSNRRNRLFRMFQTTPAWSIRWASIMTMIPWQDIIGHAA